ncbi:MAG TPA: LuxR C-terminal-related transcriptional regulator [Catenuloplanes sp.]
MTQETLAVPSLQRWGVSADADLMYRALVMMGPRTSAVAARQLGVTDARVRRALDELAAVGAARRAGGAADGLWSAVPAGQVLTALHRPRRRAPSSPVERWVRQVRTVAGIDLDHAAPGTVLHLPTRSLARERIGQLMAAERHEHLAMNNEEVISADAARAALPGDRSLRARGVQLRVVGLPAADESYRDFVDAGELTRAEGDYREADTLPLKLMVFDRRAALFPADPRNFEAGAVVVTHPPAVEQFTRLFYQTWATARDPRREGVPPIVLTIREQAIVAMLAAGHTEQSAADALGLSRRTVVYTLRTLMDRLQVENRFQLALVLGGTRSVPLPSPYDDAPSYPAHPE